MKKTCKLVSVFLIMALLTGCAHSLPDNTSDTTSTALLDSNSTISVADSPAPTTADTFSADSTSPTTANTFSADSTSPTTADAFASTEPPLSEHDRTIPVPDFLTQEQKELYWKAYSLFYLFRVCPDYIDNMTIYPYEPVDYGYDYFSIIELDGHEYHPAIGRYHDWDTFDSMMRGVFTDSFTESLYNGLGYPSFREIDGVTCYISYERGTDPTYNTEANPVSFEKIVADEVQIEFTVTAEYRGFHWDETTQDFIENDPTYETYSIRFEKTDAGWRIAQFNVPY